MSFLTLWDRYLSKTMPSLSDGALLLLYLQIFAGALPPLATLFRAVRRENKWETAMLCMVPGIFIFTAAIIEPMFFGSFLGDGFPWVEDLRRFLHTPAFFKDALLLAGAFTVLAVLFLLLSRQSRFLALHVLLSVGVEVFIVAAVAATAADYFLLRGRLFLSLGDKALKWFVYGLYLLFHKGVLFLTCLVWCLLFSERQDRAAARGDYALWLRHYVAGSYRTMGIALLLFSALFAAVVVGGLYQEGSYGMAGTFFIWNVLMVLGALALLLCSLFPVLLPGYRRICRWGDLEETGRLLYQEIRQKPPLAQTMDGTVTAHFLIVAAPFRRIYRLDLLEHTVPLGGGVRLRFKDGSSCNISAASRPLLQALGRVLR